MKAIRDIIESHQRETYPNGVGSIFRCIESDSFRDIEDEIKKLVLDNIMNDLYCDIKKEHSKEAVKEWVEEM